MLVPRVVVYLAEPGCGIHSDFFDDEIFSSKRIQDNNPARAPAHVLCTAAACMYAHARAASSSTHKAARHAKWMLGCRPDHYCCSTPCRKTAHTRTLQAVDAGCKPYSSPAPPLPCQLDLPPSRLMLQSAAQLQCSAGCHADVMQSTERMQAPPPPLPARLSAGRPAAQPEPTDAALNLKVQK